MDYVLDLDLLDVAGGIFDLQLVHESFGLLETGRGYAPDRLEPETFSKTGLPVSVIDFLLPCLKGVGYAFGVDAAGTKIVEQTDKTDVVKVAGVREYHSLVHFAKAVVRFQDDAVDLVDSLFVYDIRKMLGYDLGGKLGKIAGVYIRKDKVRLEGLVGDVIGKTGIGKPRRRMKTKHIYRDVSLRNLRQTADRGNVSDDPAGSVPQPCVCLAALRRGKEYLLGQLPDSIYLCHRIRLYCYTEIQGKGIAVYTVIGDISRR